MRFGNTSFEGDRGVDTGAAVRAYCRHMSSHLERACGKAIPVKFVPRRAGDIATSFADASRAAAELGWKAVLDLDAMCRDAWRWQSQNPAGYP